MEEYDRFRDLFNGCLAKIIERFPYKEGEERQIMGFIVNNYLLEVSCDLEKLDFRDFYDKYLQGSLFLGCNDFTKSEVKKIIEEARLNERDSKLATMYWIDLLSEDDIGYKLGIDRKTVRNNIPKISYLLKRASARFVKEK